MGDSKSIAASTNSAATKSRISVGDNDDAYESISNERSISRVSAHTPRPKGWGKRHSLSILAFWGLVCTYAMRFNMSLAITAMAKTKNAKSISKYTLANVSSDTDDICTFEDTAYTGSKRSLEEGEFDWDEAEQGIILSSFFWGYIITQLPGGIVASKIGGKWPLGLGICLSGIMTFLIPVAARMNIGMLLYCRVLQGLSQGFIFPAIQQILAAWAPPNERSFLTALAYSGCQFGAAFSMITTGYLITGTEGWPSVFYFTGTLTILWFIFWCLFVFNTPREHPTISPEEREYIITSIGTQELDSSDRIPWKSIFTSKPVWVIAICELLHTWGFYTLLMELPTYLKSVLNFHMEENSWLSAAPYIVMWAFSNIATFVADVCITKKVAKTLTIRKTCHLIAELGAGFSLIGAAFIGCDRWGAVILLTLAVGVSGLVCGSYVPNQVELANNYAGILMGIINTIGNIAGFIVSIVTGELTLGHGKDQRRWRLVFLISSGLYFVSALLYVSFATCHEQSWNRKKKTTNLEETVPLISNSKTTQKPSSEYESVDTAVNATLEKLISQTQENKQK